MRLLHFFTKNKLRKYLYDENGKYLVKWINFEFCSFCNLRCKWCTLDHSKKKELMNPEILAKVLDEISDCSKFDIERVDLHNAGETLLHPNLEKMLDEIAKRREKFKKTTFHLLTNATLLDDKKSDIIIKSNALDEIRFSVDGGTTENYKDIRRGSDWELVRNNILKFAEKNNKKIKTGIICIIPPEKPYSTDWMDSEFKNLFSRIDNIELRYPHNWDGSEKLNLDKPLLEESRGRVCKFLLKNLVILPSGDVTVCCADLNSRGVIGNVLRASLEKTVFSRKRLDMINLFSKKKKNKIELCKNCNGYYE